MRDEFGTSCNLCLAAAEAAALANSSRLLFKSVFLYSNGSMAPFENNIMKYRVI